MADEKKPLIEHLEELRRRLLFCIVSVAALSALSYSFSKEILRHFSKYVNRLIFITPAEAFLSYLKISLFCGLILSAPVILFNALRFVWVALKKREKGLFVLFFASGIFLFVSGCAFSYFAAIPIAINFLLSYSSDFLRPYISVSQYISFTAFILLGSGVIFELPLFVILLARVGLIKYHALQAKRRYFIVAAFVIAAFLTPPDIITQIILALPLIALYEISILAVKILERRGKHDTRRAD
ncbi:MAG: twin-arginine translocase subunit TatC [Candidatus Omnitrophica bacterium]|nr:twin-arginine translocase subunit TatC [Candidatus Omnitrophota bacterium]